MFLKEDVLQEIILWFHAGDGGIHVLATHDCALTPKEQFIYENTNLRV